METVRLLAKELFFYLFKLTSFCTDARTEEVCPRKSYRAEFKLGLQNWLSTLQRSPFFRHHFSKSTLKSALFPRQLCVGRMRVDMTIYGEGQAVRVATPSRSSTTSWASSSDKHAILKLLVNTNATTASSDSVRTFRLLRNSCFVFFKFFRVRHVLHVIVKPVGATDSDDDEVWRRWVTRALPYWRLVKRSWAKKKEKKPVQRWKIVSKPATCKFTPFIRRCRVACEPERHSTPQESGRHLLQKKKKRKNDGWNGWDRCGRCTVRGADWPQAATVAVGQPISARWLWRRRYSNMPPPFTKWKTFPGAPHQELSNDTKFERHRQC